MAESISALSLNLVCYFDSKVEGLNPSRINLKKIFSQCTVHDALKMILIVCSRMRSYSPFQYFTWSQSLQQAGCIDTAWFACSVHIHWPSKKGYSEQPRVRKHGWVSQSLTRTWRWKNGCWTIGKLNRGGSNWMMTWLDQDTRHRRTI